MYAEADLPQPEWPRAADRDLLGIEVDPTDRSRARVTLAPHLLRRDGVLFGGAALGVALASFEAASQRPVRWATVQFVASAGEGEVLEVAVTTAAHGRSVDQVQLHATVGDRLVFTAVGSTGDRSGAGITGQGLTMPEVDGPDGAGRFGIGTGVDPGRVGHHLVSDFLEVPLAAPRSPGHLAMWARVIGESRTTPATLGFLADMVPIAVCRAAGVEGAGTSLDNSLRVGRLVDTEWVLVELEAHAAADGFGYGVSHLWAPDGTLLATGSQTAKLFSFASFLQRLEGDDRPT